MRKILFIFQESFYFLFSCYLSSSYLENLHDKGELCEVNMVRNDYVWLSDAVAPLPTWWHRRRCLRGCEGCRDPEDGGAGAARPVGLQGQGRPGRGCGSAAQGLLQFFLFLSGTSRARMRYIADAAEVKLNVLADISTRTFWALTSAFIELIGLSPRYSVPLLSVSCGPNRAVPLVQ